MPVGRTMSLKQNANRTDGVTPDRREIAMITMTPYKIASMTDNVKATECHEDARCRGKQNAGRKNIIAIKRMQVRRTMSRQTMPVGRIM